MPSIGSFIQFLFHIGFDDLDLDHIRINETNQNSTRWERSLQMIELLPFYAWIMDNPRPSTDKDVESAHQLVIGARVS